MSPGFFDTFGVNFVQGRDFAWHDDLRSTPVAIVNATLARRLFADGTAIGRRIRVGTDSARRELSIVGVVGDVVMTNLRAARTVPVVFRPTLQEPQFARASNIDVRLRGDRQTVEPAIRQTVTGLGHEYIRSTETLDEEIDRVLLQERLLATISWCCAALAALIAFVGLYGLLADMVTRRTREIGIRMALGASRRAVVDMIVREALVLTSIGVLVGVPCAVIAARTTSTLLFGLAPSDPRTIFVAAASLLIVGILAGASPARRASRIDPAIALRAE